MTFTHESGHIIGGWLGGGDLKDAQLYPWQLPYSTFDPDPHPLITLWCGPVLGVLIPLAFAVLIRCEGMWFIAYFCVLANGSYLAIAWITGDRLLDTPKLLDKGETPLSIAIYCLLTIGVGYWGFRKSCVKVLSPKLINPPPSSRFPTNP